MLHQGEQSYLPCPSQMESIQTCSFPEKPPCHQNISQDNSPLTPVLLKITSCKRKSKAARSSKVMGRSDLTLGLYIVCTSFLLSTNHETPNPSPAYLVLTACALCSFLSGSIGSSRLRMQQQEPALFGHMRDQRQGEEIQHTGKVFCK